jgi:hypothetical protein
LSGSVVCSARWWFTLPLEKYPSSKPHVPNKASTDFILRLPARNQRCPTYVRSICIFSEERPLAYGTHSFACLHRRTFADTAPATRSGPLCRTVAALVLVWARARNDAGRSWADCVRYKLRQCAISQWAAMFGFEALIRVAETYEDWTCCWIATGTLALSLVVR